MASGYIIALIISAFVLSNQKAELFTPEAYAPGLPRSETKWLNVVFA
jgi:hypothetical protein